MNHSTAMNDTHSSELEQEDEMSMGLGARAVWDSLFVAMIAVAIVGNLIVLWIILAHRYMRTIPNAFIANMSLSDLCMAAFNTSFNYVYMRDNRWDFGAAYCRVNNFLAILTVSATVLNLTAMSIDRYKAIVWPLRARNSKRCVVSTIIAIWLFSGLFAMPCIVFSTVLEFDGRKICYVRWPDEDNFKSRLDHIYNVLIMLTTYVIPIALNCVATCHMSLALWHAGGMLTVADVETEQFRRAERKKKKIVKMLIVLMVIFGVCWLPYHAYFLALYYIPTLGQTAGIQHVFLAFYWLAMSHGLVNPVVYFVMNPTFRRYYRYILTFRFLKSSQSEDSRGMTLGPTRETSVAGASKFMNGGCSLADDGTLLPLSSSSPSCPQRRTKSMYNSPASRCSGEGAAGAVRSAFSKSDVARVQMRGRCGGEGDGCRRQRSTLGRLTQV